MHISLVYTLGGALMSVFSQILGFSMAHKDPFIMTVNPLVSELQCLSLLMKAVAEVK